MPQLDLTSYTPQIFWLIAVFLCLWWLMAKIALPRIGLVLEERQSKINDNLDTANNLHREAKTELETYEKLISEAHENARTIINDANQQGIETSLSQQSELRDSLTKQIANAEKEIESAKELALKNIKQSAREVASAALSRLGGINITEEKLNTAIENMINKDSQ